MKIFYTSKAEKQLIGLPKSELKKIFSKIEKLSDESGAGKPLKGEFDGLYSLRAWPYRIIYKVEEGALVICSVAHRQGVYK
ncbi:MAG: Plasmid stabilization system [Candidatus Collierbacteria bacterium GW2011_GWC2_44_18]|uniref:Plasmid stabilization system n=1 Tax=Candidatus Collierbacteria bacterium GW2011_GWC2_44_18 TaxID=1618392 RepID=A0A0G1HN81_9BACT|nr:MAG: Plasmid stabilization system [Candidatus Levybacteria bacterium GW2011_GWA2_37_36]KKT29154.1 MAG: Plasmid stabilization system [Microgenomates group bacterium GW2011_GWC1_44_10]KKT48380.1 MAG: Plasmid stabilization system [Candidatus Collierbacteria bacterium GW2011_GWC2_44_18]